jgi:hypothetical protein
MSYWRCVTVADPTDNGFGSGTRHEKQSTSRIESPVTRLIPSIAELLIGEREQTTVQQLIRAP